MVPFQGHFNRIAAHCKAMVQIFTRRSMRVVIVGKLPYGDISPQRGATSTPLERYPLALPLWGRVARQRRMGANSCLPTKILHIRLISPEDGYRFFTECHYKRARGSLSVVAPLHTSLWSMRWLSLSNFHEFCQFTHL